jgi:hypothetical protein
MPVELTLRHSGMSAATRAVMDLPGNFSRAKKSAMGSVGWLVMGHLRNHMEYGGQGWEGLHDLTNVYRKKRGANAGNWVKRQRKPFSPASWLGKFARYRLSKSGNTVQVDFGKGRSKGKNPGRSDPQLAAIARRIDGGERIAVTKQMRKKWAATWYRAGKNKIVGVNFFPLKKSTKFIEIPERPIFDPVFRKISPLISSFFEEKFWDSYHRKRK